MVFLWFAVFWTRDFYWTMPCLLSIGSTGTNFNGISIKIQWSSFEQINLEMSANYGSFCLVLHELRYCNSTKNKHKTKLSSFISALIHVAHRIYTLQWRHNEPDGVSNQGRLDCLLNRLLRRRSKKKPKLRVTGLCEGKPPVTGGFPSTKGQQRRKCWRHHAPELLYISCIFPMQARILAK